MTSTIVPPVDLAPGMPSRVVTISATDVTEGGESLEGQMVRFALSDTLDVSSGGDVIAKTQAEVVLDSNGEGRIRLPVYSDDVKTWCGKDWAILVTATWGSQKAIRVPAGTSSIALSALPSVRPLRGRELQWAITGASVTVTEGAQWGATVGLSGGVLGFNFTVPPAAVAYWRGTVAAGTSHTTITDPGVYGVLAGRLIDGPDGAGSGYLRDSELVAGTTTREHRYEEHGTGRIWKSTRGTTGWGAWSRVDGVPEPPPAVESGSLNDLIVGKYLVVNPSAVTGGPPTAEPGLYDRSGEVDEYVEQGTLAVRWIRRRVGGLMSHWVKTNAETVAPVHLSRPLAASTETVSSRSVRIPFQVAARVRSWRVVIRNANYRTNTAYSGNMTMRTVCIGTGARDADGQLTSSFAPSTSFPQGKRILVRDAGPFDGGEGWASAWRSTELIPGTDYMLSYGYQHNGIETQLSMGGGWWTNFNPMNAELTDDPTAAKVNRVPFDVRIECMVDDKTVQDVLIGDSISAGSNADFPVLEAPTAIAGRVEGRSARLHGFGGASFGEWTGPNWGDPASMKWQDVTAYGRADRAVIALGNNDIHAGTDLTTLQARLRSLIALVRERVSTNVVVCTVTPRTAWVGTGKETLRAAFNDWLRTYPEGIAAVADTARAVEDSTGHAPRADYVVSDGIHFNTAGSTALANAILETRVQSQATGADDALSAYITELGS